MPFVGLRGGERVGPYDVSIPGIVFCPKCNEQMGIKERHYNQGQIISRHFYHKTNTDCEGESDIHIRMKTIAQSTLEEMFPEHEVEQEHHIGDRFADVCVVFPSPIPPFGKGIVCEVQHKNKQKDIGKVSQEYMNEGFSVYWAYLSDFGGTDGISEPSGQMEISDDRLWTLWPDAVPEPEGYPKVIQHLRQLRDKTACADTEVVLPDEYWRVHRLEFASPTQSKYQTEWTLFDDVWLHSKGDRICWFNILGSPNAETYIELMTKVRSTSEVSHIPVSIDQKSVERLESFINQVQTVVSGGEYDTPNSTWKPICSARFSGGDQTKGWLSIGSDSNGSLSWRFGRADDRGNSRSLRVEFRNGDVYRLSSLPTTVRQESNLF